MRFIRQAPEEYTPSIANLQQAETFTPPTAEFAKAGNISWDPSLRGTSGPVQYSYANYFFPGSGE